MLLPPRLRFLLKYLSAGALGTVVNLVVVPLASLALPLGLASAVGLMAGGQVAFYAHTHGPFREREPNRRFWHQWAVFTFGNLVCALIINQLLVICLLAIHVNGAALGSSHLGSVIALALAFCLTWPCNFVWNNFVVFRNAQP